MRKHLLAVASAATLAFGASAPAYAYMVVDLTDTGTATVKSCSTFDLASKAACTAAGFTVISDNIVQYTGMIGGYMVDVTGSSVNVPGSVAEAYVDLSYTRVRNNTSGGQLFFNATGFGYTLPAGPLMSLFASQGSSTGTVSAGGTVETQGYADPWNTGLFLNQVGCTNAVATSSNCSSNAIEWTRGAGPFSLTDIVIFTLGQGQDLNGSSNVTAKQIPEPVSTALVGLGLLGLGLFSRRRHIKV